MNNTAEGIFCGPCFAGLVFCAALVVQVWYFVRPLLCRSGILCGPCCAGLVFCAALVLQVWYFVRPLLCRSGISTGDSFL